MVSSTQSCRRVDVLWPSAAVVADNYQWCFHCCLMLLLVCCWGCYCSLMCVVPSAAFVSCPPDVAVAGVWLCLVLEPYLAECRWPFATEICFGFERGILCEISFCYVPNTFSIMAVVVSPFSLCLWTFSSRLASSSSLRMRSHSSLDSVLSSFNSCDSVALRISSSSLSLDASPHSLLAESISSLKQYAVNMAIAVLCLAYVPQIFDDFLLPFNGGFKVFHALLPLFNFLVLQRW